jgi:hypothetical protein
MQLSDVTDKGQPILKLPRPLRGIWNPLPRDIVRRLEIRVVFLVKKDWIIVCDFDSIITSFFHIELRPSYFEVACHSIMDEKQIHKSCEGHGTGSATDVMSTPIENGIQLVRDEAVDKHGIRLHPQPTSDPLDPLNWSSLQKHGILSIVMLK